MYYTSAPQFRTLKISAVSLESGYCYFISWHGKTTFQNTNVRVPWFREFTDNENELKLYKLCLPTTIMNCTPLMHCIVPVASAISLSISVPWVFIDALETAQQVEYLRAHVPVCAHSYFIIIGHGAWIFIHSIYSISDFSFCSLDSLGCDWSV